MNSLKKSDHFYLIDGSGYIFRAYYALPPLSRKSDGLPTGAVSGFCSMLFKLLEDSRSDDSIHKPTHFAVIFDSAKKNFRNDIYSEYKANRTETPEDLIPQFEYIRKAVKAFNLPSIELINYEADDLLAKNTKKIVEAGAKVTVISSDKDLMQLVSEKIRLYDPMKNKVLGEKEVFEKFGVKPNQVIDVQSLAGDPSDNIPGVPGITGMYVWVQYSDSNHAYCTVIAVGKKTLPGLYPTWPSYTLVYHSFSLYGGQYSTVVRSVVLGRAYSTIRYIYHGY